jgi:hypothetical protein
MSPTVLIGFCSTITRCINMVRVIEVNVLNSIKGLVVKKMYYDNDCLELSLGFFVDAKINSEQICTKFRFVRNEIL